MRVGLNRNDPTASGHLLFNPSTAVPRRNAIPGDHSLQLKLLLTSQFYFLSEVKDRESESKYPTPTPTSFLPPPVAIRETPVVTPSHWTFGNPLFASVAPSRELWRHEYSNWSHELLNRVLFPQNIIAFNRQLCLGNKVVMPSRDFESFNSNPFLRYLIARNMSTNWSMNSPSTATSNDS